MLKILGALLLSILFGMLLVSGAMSWPIRPGLVGLAAMLVSAWAARRYWQAKHEDERIGSPERALWHGLTSYGLLSGHLAAIMIRLGPPFDMHSLAGHAMAVDNWTLVFGSVLSFWIARDPEPRQDERDSVIAAKAWRASHIAVLVLLLPLILALGFAGETVVGRFSQPMIAHLLIFIILLQCLFWHIVQLRLYWLEACAQAAQNQITERSSS